MQGRYWTLLTALFVHGSVLHLFGNMLFLFVFGGTLENNIGSGRHLTVFLTGGLTGFVLSLPFVASDAGMLGASAAIFAIAACVMLVRPLKFSWLFLAPQGLVAIVYFLYNVVVVYDSRLIPGYDPQVGYIAHVIGFVTGIPFGIAWSNSWKKNFLITLVLLGIYVAILTIVADSLKRLSESIHPCNPLSSPESFYDNSFVDERKGQDFYATSRSRIRSPDSIIGVRT